MNCVHFTIIRPCLIHGCMVQLYSYVPELLKVWFHVSLLFNVGEWVLFTKMECSLLSLLSHCTVVPFTIFNSAGLNSEPNISTYAVGYLRREGTGVAVTWGVWFIEVLFAGSSYLIAQPETAKAARIKNNAIFFDICLPFIRKGSCQYNVIYMI